MHSTKQLLQKLNNYRECYERGVLDYQMYLDMCKNEIDNQYLSNQNLGPIIRESSISGLFCSLR